jgi:2-keto-3-deoxy-L-rhamnonate aldolase RhmA
LEARLRLTFGVVRKVERKCVVGLPSNDTVFINIVEIVQLLDIGKGGDLIPSTHGRKQAKESMSSNWPQVIFVELSVVSK